ncbi:hypothetical protein GGR50DRAFT_699040 [Xylaria sp. CBS 124048]|nr:hypothetical protein GGR50DRAFT_699040 [Xylaria sp. CBS 124048]
MTTLVNGLKFARRLLHCRAFCLGGSVWALWITGLWLELPLSIGRNLPCGCCTAPLGDGLRLGPVSPTVSTFLSCWLVWWTGVLGNLEGKIRRWYSEMGLALNAYAAARQVSTLGLDRN